MKPRIAILTNYAYDESRLSGGVETATEGLLEGLVAYQDEFEFHVVALTDHSVSTINEMRRGFDFHFVGIPHNWFQRPRSIYNIGEATRLLRRMHPVLVHCQDNQALALAAIRAGRVDLFTVHGVKREEASRWKGEEFWSHQMDGMLERFVHRKFRSFIAISEYARSMMPEGKRVFRIPNPLPGIWFQDADLGHEKVMRILCVGSYNWLKRQHRLLEAIGGLGKELGNIQILFCGPIDDRTYFDMLRKTAVKNGLANVVFRPPIQRAELVGLMTDGTLLVHPSANENSPMVIAEGMARGLPILASNVGGIPEMIRPDIDGILFTVDDVNELKESLRRLVADAALRRRLGSSARKRAREIFDPASIARQTVEVYRLLLNEQRAATEQR